MAKVDGFSPCFDVFRRLQDTLSPQSHLFPFRGTKSDSTAGLCVFEFVQRLLQKMVFRARKTTGMGKE
jgi:hypothetical protein